ncbi:hypothetical protein [Nocardioides sp. MH1]|uniref:hypothetical protein n=1 Tax=Nocardioides sp. MH1 TaxID=3242490 RepID=UPI003522C858
MPAHVDGGDVEQRILEASAVVPPQGAVTGWAALRWLGARWLSGRDRSGARQPVPILISTHNIRPQHGILPCGEGCSPEVIEVVDGVRVTNALWSASFAMRYADTLGDAVIALSMAAYADLVSVAEATAMIGAQSSWTGVPQARKALPCVGENAWSPMEADSKLLCEIAGYGPLLQNRPVFDLAGRHVGTPDLIDPAAGVVIEYNGSDHLEPGQYLVDVRRDARFRDHYLEAVVRSAGDRRDHFLTRVEAAYRRAGRRRTPRTWTIEPPPGWISTDTVAARRALSPEDRARLLGYRHR